MTKHLNIFFLRNGFEENFEENSLDFRGALYTLFVYIKKILSDIRRKSHP